jgi:cell division protease FtsH
MDEGRRKQFRLSAIYVLIAVAGVWLFQQVIFRPLVIRWTEVPCSEFLTQLEEGNIEEVTLGGERISYTCCTVPEGDPPDQVYNVVPVEDLDLAIERVVAGLQRKVPLRDEVRRKVAHHEGGHALVLQLLPNTDPVHKVSIIPTAKGALGYRMQMPEEDQYLLGEQELKDRIVVMLGGRAAELFVFAESSIGAANDLERATELARRTVTEFGMTEALGPVRYANEGGYGFFRVRQGVRQDLGPETAALIDREMCRLVEEGQGRALDLLRAHEVARVLQENEVIDGAQVARIASGEGVD